MCDTLAGYRVIVGPHEDANAPLRPLVRACGEHLTNVVDQAFATYRKPVVVTSTSEWMECQWDG
jgi:hypothetical protein